MTKPNGKSQPQRGAPEPESTASSIGKQVVLGMGLLLAAFLFWEVRDLVPSWAAQSVTVNVEFATTTERDDVRVTRAFETAMRTVAADADLEPLPNPTQVRYTQLTVRAPSSAAAIAQATALAEATSAAFSRGGTDPLSVNLRRRTIPVPDSTTILLGNAVSIGAGAAGILGLALIALGWFRLQSGPDRLSPQNSRRVGGAVALTLAPILLPDEIIVALMIMAIPMLLAGLILWKTMQVRTAASWPSTRARIIKSQLRAQHQRRAGGVTEIVNVPAIEYEFRLGDRVIRGTRIGIGEITDGARETLHRYPVGAAVPVYYDPQNPEQAFLERDPPVPVTWLYLIAGGLSVAGLAMLAVFWHGTALLAGLEGYLPAGAFVPGMLFFAVGGLMLFAMLWAARRQVAEASGWPVTAGHIVSSTVEHYRDAFGRSGSSSGSATFYEPIVEYSYHVNGLDFHGTRLSFGGNVAASERLAAAKAAQYPLGSEVLVHYDPQNPSNAVLDLKVAYATPFLVIALVFLGLAVFFSGAFR